MELYLKFFIVFFSVFVGSTHVQAADLKEKISQMIMLGFKGKRNDDPGVMKIKQFLSENWVGHVVLYARNIESPEQLSELTSFLNEDGTNLIAVDQEGGRVQRLTEQKGFSSVPSAIDVRNTSAVDEAYNVYLQMAQMLKEYGINYNLAPVVDLNNPDSPCPAIGYFGRSYAADSNDVEGVVKYASAFLKAHEEVGVITALKHFPGHGLAQTDTHVGFTDITQTYVEVESQPFYELIPTASSIMTAHVTHREWDAEYPVTLSDKVIAERLKPKFEDGVIISDDLGMGAIEKNYKDLGEIVVKAIRAGHDILVFSHPADTYGKDFESFPSRIHESILKAIESGELSEERIDQSYQRIMKMKDL